MGEISFNKAEALEWLRTPAEGMDAPRAEDYSIGDIVDESQLEAVVEDFKDTGAGFGLPVNLWADGLLDQDSPGLHVTVDLPVSEHESITPPLRLAGPWAELRGWVDLDAYEDTAEPLAEFLDAVAREARAALIHARAAVRAGALT